MFGLLLKRLLTLTFNVPHPLHLDPASTDVISEGGFHGLSQEVTSSTLPPVWTVNALHFKLTMEAWLETENKGVPPNLQAFDEHVVLQMSMWF